MLRKFTEQRIIPLGILSANRDRAGLEGMIGLFVNELVVAVEVDEHHSFRHLLRSTQEHVLSALTHQIVPFDQLISALECKRNLTYAPLCQMAFNYHQDHLALPNFGQLQVRSLDTQPGFAKYELCMETWRDIDGHRTLSLSYSDTLYSRTRAETLMNSYLHLLQQALEQPDCVLSEIRALPLSWERRFIDDLRRNPNLERTGQWPLLLNQHQRLAPPGLEARLVWVDRERALDPEQWHSESFDQTTLWSCYREDGTILSPVEETRRIKADGVVFSLDALAARLRKSDLLSQFELHHAANQVTLVGRLTPGVSEQHLLAWCEDQLPVYMVPHSFRLDVGEQATRTGQEELSYVETLARQRRIWTELLHLEEFHDQASFFSLGGNSLLAVQLIRSLNSEFALDMPVSVIFQKPDVKRLAEHIHFLKKENRKRSDFQGLVKLGKKEEGEPLFLIHPTGGEVLCYRLLARFLGQTTPLLGIESGQGGDSVTEMAQRYSERILSYSDRPFSLGGWSLGGLIAHEMGCLLAEAGQAPQRLIAIDAPLLTQAQVHFERNQVLYQFGRGLGISEQTLRDWASTGSNHGEDDLMRMLARLREQGYLEKDYPQDAFLAQFQRFSQQLQAGLEHRPRRYNGSLLVIEAKPFFEGPHVAVPLDHLAAEFKRIVFSCDHFELLQLPHAARLSMEIKRYLGKA